MLSGIQMLNDTLKIINQGFYIKNGKTVNFKYASEQLRQIKVLLPDDVTQICNKNGLKQVSFSGRFGHSCQNMDSFALARSVYDSCSFDFRYKESNGILVLNLANPVNPGGGVRRGARAQEEDLCRKSSLLLSLESEEAQKYYRYNRAQKTYLGTDAMMLTPAVEIIRDENGELLDETVVVSVLTCAAPLVRYGKEGLSEQEYQDMVFNRIAKMLKCSAYFGYKHLVLGAWGCGAFGNDAKVISDLFYKALKELEYCKMREKDLFRRVDFAVLDRTQERYNFKEFQRNFAQENFYRDEDENRDNEMIVKIKETIKEKEKHLDKIRGCLFGGAVGDALGYPVEFYDERTIFDIYGDGGIQEFKLCNNGKALISDDTQMTLFTANGLLNEETFRCLRGSAANPWQYVADAYQDWLTTQNFDFDEIEKANKDKKFVSWLCNVPELYDRRAPGGTCLSALSNFRHRYDYVRAKVNNSKGCGGVMRVAPVALKECKSIEELDKEAAQIAAITHGHSLGYMTASVLVHIINRIIFGDKKSTLKQIVIEARDTVYKLFADDKHIGELTSIIDRAIELSENNNSDLENIHMLGEGWVAEETLAIAIYCSLKYKNDFSRGIIAVVNHKGDSDSTGAVTGNILGALLGYESIEDKWKQNLELSDVIIEIADDICHGCQMSEHNSYCDEEWLRKYTYVGR